MIASSESPSKKKMSQEQVFEETQLEHENERLDRMRWGPVRKASAAFVECTFFNISMSLLIVLNMLFVIIEVDYGAEGVQVPSWLNAANIFVLSMYFVEMFLKLFVLRKKFFRDALAVFDLFVITVDITVTVVVAVWPLNLAVPVVLARLARILKVTRALRMLTVFPELNFMVKGMLFASKTIIWGVILLGLLLCVSGIFAVLFIHPVAKELEREGYWTSVGCDRCANAFSSVPKATLTLCHQLIVGDGWSVVNTPLMEKRPETAVYFIAVMVTTTLAALNLFLGLVVEKATEAKAVSLREEAEKKETVFRDASRRLYTLCHELDEDGSGTLTLDELQAGCRENSDFSDLLRAMDIDESELEVVFSMLDRDGSGDIEYQEFVEQLHMMKNHDAHTLLVFIKFYVMEIRSTVSQVGGAAAPRVRPSFILGDTVSRVATRNSEASCNRLLTSPMSPMSSGTAHTWPDLDRELRCLVELRQEVLNFAHLQTDRLGKLQSRIERAGRLFCPTTSPFDPSRARPHDEVAEPSLGPIGHDESERSERRAGRASPGHAALNVAQLRSQGDGPLTKVTIVDSRASRPAQYADEIESSMESAMI